MGLADKFIEVARAHAGGQGLMPSQVVFWWGGICRLGLRRRRKQIIARHPSQPNRSHRICSNKKAITACRVKAAITDINVGDNETGRGILAEAVGDKKTPPVPWVTVPLNLLETGGTRWIASTSSKGLSATTTTKVLDLFTTVQGHSF